MHDKGPPRVSHGTHGRNTVTRQAFHKTLSRPCWCPVPPRSGGRVTTPTDDGPARNLSGPLEAGVAGLSLREMHAARQRGGWVSGLTHIAAAGMGCGLRAYGLGVGWARGAGVYGFVGCMRQGARVGKHARTRACC